LRNDADTESNNTPDSLSSSLPSVASMAGKKKRSIDLPAVAVFALGLILVAVVAFGWLSSMKGRGGLSPARQVSEFVNDIERQVVGYIAKIERLFGPGKSAKQKAKNYVLVGYRYYKERQFDKAIGAFDKAVKLDSESADAYFWRGRSRMSISRYDEAVADFKTAVKLNPAYVDAYDNLGWLYARAGNYHEGVSNLTKAIELKPDNGWAYYYRARIHHTMGEEDPAVRDAKEACRLGFQEGCTLYEKLKKGII
jgi:tetratricopeptide (TPR) repeat protein